jgi:hypothetical protein
MTPASESLLAFTMIMKRILVSPFNAVAIPGLDTL